MRPYAQYRFVMDLGVSRDEAIYRLASVTQCEVCRGMLRTWGAEVFCSRCGRGLSNALPNPELPPPLPGQHHAAARLGAAPIRRQDV